MEKEFANFTPEQDEILEDTNSMEEKLEALTEIGARQAKFLGY